MISDDQRTTAADTGALPLPASDLELVQAFQNGSSAAFTELMQRYQKRLINFAYRMLGRRADAEDIAQETFLRLYRAPHRFQPQAQFSTWLFTIARNMCLNAIRNRKHHRTYAISQAGARLQLPDPGHTPPRLLETGEAQAAVRRAISELPEKQRTAVVLAKYEGMAYRQIADILGCSETAVKLIMHRARLRLRHLLAPYVQERKAT